MFSIPCQINENVPDTGIQLNILYNNNNNNNNNNNMNMILGLG